MTPEYSPISLKFAREYQNLLRQCCASRASDYSFGNIWGWAEHYGLKWRTCGKLCWLRQTKPHVVNWAPVGDWRTHPWGSCQDLASELAYIRVPEELLHIWQNLLPPERLRVTEARGHWDYLYSPEELATLPGNRFHNKKNLLNQFKKNYNFSYAPLSANCVEAVLHMQEEWVKWREVEDSPSLLAENQAIHRVLEAWDAIPGLSGGAIRLDGGASQNGGSPQPDDSASLMHGSGSLPSGSDSHLDGQVVAYTVGEAICADTVVVHFEKEMPGFKGIYQAINNSYAQAINNNNIKYLNREQDLDDEGLRKAKESYNPVGYVKKYEVTILPKPQS